MSKYIIDISDIVARVISGGYKAIVVEGYDGVGKGKVLEDICKTMVEDAPIYRPDYNFWSKHSLPKSHRWAINAAYLDILRQTDLQKGNIVVLFDRGMLSGMVYNDIKLSVDYKYLLGDTKVLHVIVRCDEYSFYKFKEVRGVDDGSSYDTCKVITEQYIKLCDTLDLDFTVIDNEYDKSLGDVNRYTCRGCGHYNQGKCQNPHVSYNEVTPDQIRCEYNLDKEVQDCDDD